MPNESKFKLKASASKLWLSYKSLHWLNLFCLVGTKKQVKKLQLPSQPLIQDKFLQTLIGEKADFAQLGNLMKMLIPLHGQATVEKGFALMKIRWYPTCQRKLVAQQVVIHAVRSQLGSDAD